MHIMYIILYYVNKDYSLFIQVANIIIQEHKGRRLAPLLKLAAICEEYDGKAFSTELKDNVQVLHLYVYTCMSHMFIVKRVFDNTQFNLIYINLID